MNGLGQRATRHRDLMTWLVAGALTITAVAVTGTYWLRTRHKEKPVVLPQNVPVDIHQQLSGYTVTHSDGNRRVYTIHAARTVSFKQGGETVLEDVLVELFGKTGNRRDLLRTQQCQYNSQNGDLFSSGPVHIELNSEAENTRASGSKGSRTVYLDTSKVSYQHEKSLVTSDEVVHFRVGAASGSSQGMVYATKDGSLDLRKDVAMELQPREGHASGPPLELTASHLRYEKPDREIILWGPVRVTQGDQKVSADGGKVFLNEANRVTRAEMEGSVRASEASPLRQAELSADRAQGEFDPVRRALRHLTAEGNVSGLSHDKGSTSHLSAERVDLDLAGAPARFQSGDASKNVQLVVESSPTLRQGMAAKPATTEKKSLTAAELKFSFRPNGKSLKDAQTVGSGKLVIDPSDPKAGQRIITAGQFLMSFTALSNLETLRGLKPTHIVFEPPQSAPPGSVAQESNADQLLATFDEATHALKEVIQSGNYTYRDGDRNASAEQSVYVAAAQGVTLTGHPRLWDAESRAKCERLRFDLATDTAEGIGKVQSTHLASGDQTTNGQAPDPTNVLADRMVAERRGQVVHYEGHVRAWRGADVVESTSLDVYRMGRRMSSGAQVLTSHLQPASSGSETPPSTGTARRETRPLTVRADSLEAFDEGSKSTYRGLVKLQTGETTMEGDKMDVYFSRIGTDQNSEVDRANAEGHVVVVQPGRRATAEHGQYSASTGQIVLIGGPPNIRDDKKGFTTGRRLTLFVHDDRLLVEGGDGTPSLSQHRVAP
jgi:LPS export ABC transporter protein LptC/lipopolysaccharide transport protein LptA